MMGSIGPLRVQILGGKDQLPMLPVFVIAALTPARHHTTLRDQGQEAGQVMRNRLHHVRRQGGIGKAFVGIIQEPAAYKLPRGPQRSSRSRVSSIPASGLAGGLPAPVARLQSG